MNLTFRRSHLAALSICLILGACGSNAGKTETAPIAPPDMAANPGGVPVPGEATVFNAEIGNTVYFDTDSFVLNSSAQEALRKQASWLTGFPQLMFTIEGHADERGTREYNLGLGERRANAVASYMVALGIASSRISVISYGKERPICAEATEACWGQNRRGVTAINSN